MVNLSGSGMGDDFVLVASERIGVGALGECSIMFKDDDDVLELLGYCVWLSWKMSFSIATVLYNVAMSVRDILHCERSSANLRHRTILLLYQQCMRVKIHFITSSTVCNPTLSHPN